MGYVQEAFNTMRFIVSVGWSIYPLGLLVRLPAGERERQHSEPDLQPRGLREQDRLRPGYLGLGQGQHPEGRLLSRLGRERRTAKKEWCASDFSRAAGGRRGVRSGRFEFLTRRLGRMLPDHLVRSRVRAE